MKYTAVFLSIRHFCSKAILPKIDYFITTPIFYVNAAPHLGHLYSALHADASHRFHRLLCRDTTTLFSTGTDEHGSKIQQAAASAGTDLPQYCDRISEEYVDLFRKFDIDYTHFARTSSKSHKAAVQQFWGELESRGHIYNSSYSGWYCEADEAFLSEAQLRTPEDSTQPRVSAESGRPVHWVDEQNYRFRLSAFQDDLLHWLRDKNVVRPAKFHSMLVESVTSDAMSIDVSISRPCERVHWAVPVPGSTTQTIYVWLDALVSYLSVAGYPQLHTWPPDVHVLGKDILRFHGVYWPAFLIGAGLSPPKSLLVHSHWTVDDEKMSKSRGNVVSPAERINVYTSSGLRYFLLREGTPHSDANYSEEKVCRVLNSELADSLGNLLSRCCGSTVNQAQNFPSHSEQHFNVYCGASAAGLIAGLRSLPDEVKEHYSEFNFYRGIATVMAVVHEANRFFELSKPWELRKDAQAADNLDCVLHITMETLRICSIALLPIVPRLSTALLDKLGVDPDRRSWQDMVLQMDDNRNHKYVALSSQKLILYKRIQRMG